MCSEGVVKTGVYYWSCAQRTGTYWGHMFHKRYWLCIKPCWNTNPLRTGFWHSNLLQDCTPRPYKLSPRGLIQLGLNLINLPLREWALHPIVWQSIPLVFFARLYRDTTWSVIKLYLIVEWSNWLRLQVKRSCVTCTILTYDIGTWKGYWPLCISHCNPQPPPPPADPGNGDRGCTFVCYNLYPLLYHLRQNPMCVCLSTDSVRFLWLGCKSCARVSWIAPSKGFTLIGAYL